DPEMALWHDFGVRAWPTLVLISPDGFVIGQIAGEPHPDLLAQGVGDMVAQFWGRGEMAPKALPLLDGAGSQADSRLRFPGKIKPCPGSGWAIADSGHHQVVVCDDGGRELARYGSGTAGFADGPAAEAAFDGPEGLACDEAAIYVADTRNHALRRIDRGSGAVTTLAGLGVRGGVLRAPEPGAGAALASPWDIAVGAGRLWFANAGSHQLGVYDLATGMLSPAAGSGAEAILDGRADAAALVQPSGVALDGDSLYFADSETSSIRRLHLGDDATVETIVGTGLFDFGHENGPLRTARFQHPLGVTVSDGRLIVADSYNGTLRTIDLAAGTVADLPVLPCGNGLCLPLDEPAGVVAAGPGRLLVSDTNNHRIVAVDLDRATARVWME
ncbi:MAG: hypothetical protein HY985_18010, partial [Magnetospirillum sp.]|nr:hypothetical protein [Magnetospirillum sp.]